MPLFICGGGLLGPFRIIVLHIDASVGFAVPCQCYRVVICIIDSYNFVWKLVYTVFIGNNRTLFHLW